MDRAPRVESPAHAPDPRVAALWSLGLGVVALVVVQLVHGTSYWNYSEGVYALTSRMFLHGSDLYGTVVGAQLPPIFVVGAGILGIHDDITMLRVVLGVFQLAGGLLGAVAVWRITGSVLATALTAPIVLLTPWAVHEHGALTPEMLLTPPLMAGVLLADRSDRAPVVGMLAGLCAFIKIPYLLPAVVLVACSVDRRRAARWAGGTLLAQVAAAWLVFGGALWTDTVTAQFQTGTRRLSQLVGYWGQAVWNLIWLVVPAGAAVVLRYHGRDRRLILTLGAVSLATLCTAVTMYKNGTGLNSLVPIEALLVPLAVAGITLAVRWAWASTEADMRRRLVAIGLAVCLVFSVAQGVSLLVAPESVFPFLRPESAPAWGVAQTEAQVDANVARLRACDPGLATALEPYISFIAHRRARGGQPDGFLPTHAAELQDVKARILADTPLCP
jgi:hypothetical protein